MNNIDNTNIILEMYNFKKGLTLEQEDVDRQVSFHMNLLNADDLGKQHSQKSVVKSLTERLTPYTYDNSVKGLLEKLNTMVKQDELFYDLEDLYRQLENNNQGSLYRHVMKVVLDIINETNVRQQEIKILNELSIHDWIPAVKNFVFKRTTDPRDRANITSNGGKADAVYSIVEKVSEGLLTFVGDKWFFLSEKSIVPACVSDYITETKKLQTLNYLQKALEIGTFVDKKLEFKIDEDLTLSICPDSTDIFINNEKTDSSATLESIFDSALIPYMRKDLYPVIMETYNNRQNIVELDIVQRVTNITNPFLENFIFNYADSIYSYKKDTRSGNNFYEYESATIVCNEVNNSLGYDLSDFLKNKLPKEKVAKKELEDSQKFITDKLSEISEGLEKLELCGLLESNEQIKTMYDVLKEEKSTLEKDLFNVKSVLANKF
jgi:hypothetical protein